MALVNEVTIPPAFSTVVMMAFKTPGTPSLSGQQDPALGGDVDHKVALRDVHAGGGTSLLRLQCTSPMVDRYIHISTILAFPFSGNLFAKRGGGLEIKIRLA